MNTAITADAPVELLTSPWNTRFYDLVDCAQAELLVASPFLSAQPLLRVADMIAAKPGATTFRLDILTNLAVDSLLSGSLDIAALLQVAQAIPTCAVTHLPTLHAKVYVADRSAAVITSGNLTSKGLAGNHEYGVWLRDRELIEKLRTDLALYAALGNKVSADTLIALATATAELKAAHQRAEKSINAKHKAAFAERVDATKLELLKAHAKGKTTHGIFCDTIRYLLEQYGPLSTAALHPLIQQLQPDLCDDSIDRVIDGVHFGKKWKHYVRNAQQALKRQGDVAYDGNVWSLVKV